METKCTFEFEKRYCKKCKEKTLKQNRSFYCSLVGSGLSFGPFHHYKDIITLIQIDHITSGHKNCKYHKELNLLLKLRQLGEQ